MRRVKKMNKFFQFVGVLVTVLMATGVADAKKNKYKYKSGPRKGQINMKAMSTAFKKTPAGKKVKRK